MLSMAIQPTINGPLKKNPSFLPNKNLSSFNSKPSFSFHSKFPNLDLQIKPTKGIKKLPLAAAELASTETVDENSDIEPQKVKVGVKQTGKPRLVLKFIWMEKNIGLGLDQIIPGHGSVPLSPYFFWPRKDAWEELKAALESRPWISQKNMIILLNQATDIINLWQQSGGSLS